MARAKTYTKTSRVGTWISLGKDRMVRLVEFDGTRWSFPFDLTRYMVAHNQCGGLVAVYAKGIARKENCISLFTSAGLPHAVAPTIKLAGPAEVLFMCWNQEQDHLLTVLNDKSVRCFNYKGQPVSADLKLDALPQLFTPTDTGFAAVTSYLGDSQASLILVNFSEREGYVARETVLPSPFQKIIPTTSLLAIPSKFTGTGFPEVLLPCALSPLFSGVYRCTFSPHASITDLKLSISGGTVKAMALAANGSSIALAVEDGSLYFTDRSMDEMVKSTEHLPAYSNIMWTGNGCVACQSVVDPTNCDGDFTTRILVVNPQDPDSFDYVYDLPPDVTMLFECDGIRLLGNEFYQFLQVIPDEGRRMFSVGSRAHSAVLLSTFDEFMSGGAATAVSTIRTLQERPDAISEAVDDCIVTAAAEYDYAQQKRLLRIAAFGKSFCPIYDTDYFVNTTKQIRVRNTLSGGSTGVLLSQAQMSVLSEDRLLRRLIQSGLHQVAHAVCGTLGLKTDDVLIDWSLGKLSETLKVHPGREEERACAKRIVSKVKKTDSAAVFSELGRLANMQGFRAAAIIFLKAETNVLRQVPMLLSIGEPEIALKQAVATDNTDLIYTVISQLLSSRGSGAVELISSFPEAKSLLLKQMRVSESHRDVLKEFFSRNPKYEMDLGFQTYFQESDRLQKSFADARSFSDVNWEMLQECKSTAAQSLIITVRKEVERAPKTLTSTGGAFSPTTQTVPQCAIDEKYLRIQLNLVQDQTRLMKELNDSRFLSASAVDMVRFALEHGRGSVAKQLKSEYNIPEKTYQWCMLCAYSQTGQWDLIDDMGGITSHVLPQIGGEAFVTLLLSYGRLQQARQYIPRIGKIELRMEYYVQCGDWLSAAADCRRNGEHDMLSQLRERAKGNSSVLAQIDEGWNSQQEQATKFSKLFSP